MQVIFGVVLLLLVIAAWCAGAALIATLLYFGVPYVTGYGDISFGQYFVGVLIVAIIYRLLFVGLRTTDKSE